MSRTTFTLYRFENLIKTNLLYIEENPEKMNFKIKVEGDNIEEILERIYLPERLKQEMRYDIVNIVKGFQMLTMNMDYTKENLEICKKYFRDMLSRFCMVHGRFYEYKEDEI